MRLRQSIVACEFCGTEFAKWYSDIGRKKHHFCSTKCRGEWVSQEAATQERGGFKIGDAVIQKRPSRRYRRHLLGIVNGFCRRPERFRVIVDCSRYATDYAMSDWLLL